MLKRKLFRMNNIIAMPPKCLFNIFFSVIPSLMYGCTGKIHFVVSRIFLFPGIVFYHFYGLSELFGKISTVPIQNQGVVWHYDLPKPSGAVI